MRKHADPESLLPLKPPVVEILLVLLAGDSHGYAIMNQVAASTGRRVLPGALYRYLEGMAEGGLIAEAGDGDSRRRRFRITAHGRAAVEAEARRMARLARTVHELLQETGAGR